MADSGGCMVRGWAFVVGEFQMRWSGLEASPRMARSRLRVRHVRRRAGWLHLGVSAWERRRKDDGEQTG